MNRLTLREIRRRWGFILLTGALVALVASASPAAREVGPTARTDDVSKPDPAGDVKAKGLTTRERKAIDIVRVGATGDTFGAIVTVTFSGSFEAAVGRGKLAGAAAGIVLRPLRGKPTVVATLGPGVRGDDGGGIGGRGPFVVVRQGRKLTFIARNFDFTKISRLEAKTFSALARASRTIQSSSITSEVLTAIASRPGEDFWEAERREDLDNNTPEGHCRSMRERLAEERRHLNETIRDLNRARAENRNVTAARLAQDAQGIEGLIGALEKAIALPPCQPPAEDFGCEARVAKHPTAAGHTNIAVGLCKRTIDRVEMDASAPFQRVDPQGLVFHTTANTFRIVPVTVLSDHELAVAIQPPVQSVEFLQVTVQGLPSGTRVEITPSSEGKEGRMSVITAP